MNQKFYYLVFLLSFFGATYIRACPCINNCGLGSGEDICGNNRQKCVPLVIRPLDVPKPILPTPKVVCAPVGGLPPLLPIGGPCTCRKAIVTPAVVPKPACGGGCGKCGDNCGGCGSCGSCGSCGGCGGCKKVVIDSNTSSKLTLNQQQQLLFGGGSSCNNNNVDNIVSYLQNSNSQNQAAFAPADAVSLTLAYRNAQKDCRQSEGQISYGFKSIPREIPIHQKRRNNEIAEENLYKFNGQIVELKPVTCNGQSLDEEAAEDLLSTIEEEAAAQSETAQEVKRLTLGEIGYGPAKIQAAPFIDVPLASPILALEETIIKDTIGCNDGFTPGNVVIEQIPDIEPINNRPVQFPPPCPCEESICSRDKILSGLNPGFQFASQSSCSSQQQQQQQWSRKNVISSCGC